MVVKKDVAQTAMKPISTSSTVIWKVLELTPTHKKN